MPLYQRFGKIPSKRHIKNRVDNGTSFLGEGITYEEVHTTAGFDDVYSIMYHLRPPTRVLRVEPAGEVTVEPAKNDHVLRHVHLKTMDLARGGTPITGRVPMMFNEDVVLYRCRPSAQQEVLFRNAGADEVIFVHAGEGNLVSPFGRLPFRPGDYIVIGRSTTYQMKFVEINEADLLIFETPGRVQLPKHYKNPAGQLKLGAPFYERDLHGPVELVTIDRDEPTEVLIKRDQHLTRYTMASHPFDLVGWDGFAYPYTFNCHDYEPIVGRVHQPPPIHQTFEAPGFVICTFAPRPLDFHPESIKVPYVHANVECDEILYYVEGEFGSRRGVGLGSITLHPQGIHHGPHPGTIMRSEKMSRTDEMAVMMDTWRKLHLTPQAMGLDDPAYPYSWLEEGASPLATSPRG